MTIKPRYLKNLGLLGEEGQKTLFTSHVAIIGAGGLGGTVLEILARYGVGKISIVDFDDFEETNLNRQLLSTIKRLGTNKAVAACERVCEINSDCEVIPYTFKLSEDNASKILAGADIVCDCLGNIPDRFVLERAAKKLKVPFVHASVAGTEGRIMTVFPEDTGLKLLYGDETAAPKSGEEIERGTPPSTVMTIASMQAHETISILTQIQTPLRGKLLKVDLKNWRIVSVTLGVLE